MAQTETGVLETVLEYGTGKAAAIGQFAAGKTGTTSNYGDAWFVGWDSKYTVAVWVGYPEKLVPMTNDFDGGPVLGGTFPALIWHDFMTSALRLDCEREAASKHGSSPSSPQSGGRPGNPVLLAHLRLGIDEGLGQGHQATPRAGTAPTLTLSHHRTRPGDPRTDAHPGPVPRSAEYPNAHAGPPATAEQLFGGRDGSRRRPRP